MSPLTLAECKPGDIVELVLDAVRSPCDAGVIEAGTQVQIAWLHKAHGDEKGFPRYAAIRAAPFKGRPVMVMADSHCTPVLEYRAPEGPNGEVPLLAGATKRLA